MASNQMEAICNRGWRLASSNQGENVGTNSLDDLVLKDLMKVLKANALKHVGTILTLMKMWRFGVSHVDQDLYVCFLSGLIMGKTSLKIVIHVVDHFPSTC